jgi:NADP-dependent 3-hydroxy acid dehydrogenase YdfG
MASNERRLAWITGGATGIGFESARLLAGSGFRVAVSGRRDAELRAAVEHLAAAGATDAVSAPLDVADSAAVGRVARSLATHDPIEVLVCSAGINVPQRRWQDLDSEGFAKVCRINLEGVASCIAAVLPGMRERGSGSIVVIGSWAGWRFTDFTGAAYSATKFGLASIVESLNCEEGRNGIRATLVCPGEVATPILRSRPVPPSEIEIARMLRPEDVAAAVHYAVTAPAHVCINELVISPRWNRMYIGGEDLKPRG